MNKYKRRKTLLKFIIVLSEFSAVLLVAYLVALPLYPSIKFRLTHDKAGLAIEAQDADKVKAAVQNFKSSFPDAEYAVSPNRIIITKIGLNAPIVESTNADYGLSKGSWRVPESSTPDKGSNTVITGHRFKYLPPNNLTFYLLDKLEEGDIVSTIWEDKDYYYKVSEIKIVDATELSILEPTEEAILTLFTCHPIYSTEKRLVVKARLIEEI